MVNLTTLAPNIVASILDETLPLDVTLFDLAVDPPVLWEEQQRRIAASWMAPTLLIATNSARLLQMMC